VVYLKRQNFKKAEELIRRTIALDASCWEARLNLSRLYYLQGQLDQAIVIAQGVLRDDPGNYFCLNYLGTYYFKKKDFASAEDCFKRAVKANSRLNSLLMDLCLFYRFTGRDKEADELEAQIGALDRYGVAKLYFMQARSFFENGSNLQALAAIEKAIAIEPRNSDFYNLKGCILKKQGEFSLALEDFRKALELGPENWEVYNNLGNLFALNKDLRSAESFYQRAVSLNSGFADGYFNLGLICLERKDYSRAEEFFRKAVSLAGAHPLAEEQLEKIPPRVRQH
jgi:Flp pilus assembly protein TadD